MNIFHKRNKEYTKENRRKIEDRKRRKTRRKRLSPMKFLLFPNPVSKVLRVCLWLRRFLWVLCMAAVTTQNTRSDSTQFVVSLSRHCPLNSVIYVSGLVFCPPCGWLTGQRGVLIGSWGGSHSPPCTILRHFIPLPPPPFPSHTLPYVHHSYDHQWPLLIGQFQMTVTRPRRGPHLIKGKSTRRFDCRKGWMGGWREEC